jgi:hypothetical protein
MTKFQKVLITQSNYIPWKGYFDAINKVDLIILYDEMQYTRRDWRNRNRIKTPNGSMWLSIPVKVKGKYFQKINETEVLDSTWASKHWKTIYHAYSKAPFFNDYSGFFEELYDRAQELKLLSDINFLFLSEISKLLNIDTEFAWSRDFELTGDKSEKLLNLCLKLGASQYYTGPSAKGYLDEDLFKESGVKVNWLDYSKYPTYPQLYGDFEHGVTVLDTIFMVGPEAKEFYFT